MDAIFPALIGLGLWFAYEAWESGKSGTSPHPIAKIKTALGDLNAGGIPTGTPSQPGQPGYGAALGEVNPQTGIAAGAPGGLNSIAPAYGPGNFN